jgi:hypothetical protein
LILLGDCPLGHPEDGADGATGDRHLIVVEILNGKEYLVSKKISPLELIGIIKFPNEL